VNNRELVRGKLLHGRKTSRNIAARDINVHIRRSFRLTAAGSASGLIHIQIPSPTTCRSHAFRGTNTWILELMWKMNLQMFQLAQQQADVHVFYAIICN
jgi:hypothetical protein